MMIPVYSLTGETTSFTAPPLLTESTNMVFLAQAFRVYQANLRQGTAKTKNRGEINRAKKKMYKQKGTGGARHASRNAPIFVGGGVTFGPRGNANWSLKLTKKAKVQVLVEALRAQSKNIVVLADSAEAKGKSKPFAQQLQMIDEKARFVVIYDDTQSSEMRGIRNLQNASLCRVSQVTAYDIGKADKIIITKEAWQPLVKRVGADVQGRLKKDSTETSGMKKSTVVKETPKRASTKVAVSAKKKTSTASTAIKSPKKSVKKAKA